jgi:hypothetical protein
MPLFDAHPGGYANAFGMPPQPNMYGNSPYTTPPQLPDPTLAAQPPQPDPTMTANGAGGPAPGATAPLRAGVYTQLYRMGRQMPGQDNMFGSFGPQAPAPPDPMAAMAPPAPEQPAPMLRAQPAPQMAAPQPAGPAGMGPRGGMPKPQTQAEKLGADRFPRLARFMGRPVVPPPDVQQQQPQQQPQQRQRPGY